MVFQLKWVCCAGSASSAKRSLATDFDSFLRQPKPKPEGKRALPQGTGFDAYLKVPSKPQQSATSFDAFLKDSGQSLEAFSEEKLPSRPDNVKSEPRSDQVSQANTALQYKAEQANIRLLF